MKNVVRSGTCYSYFTSLFLILCSHLSIFHRSGEELKAMWATFRKEVSIPWTNFEKSGTHTDLSAAAGIESWLNFVGGHEVLAYAVLVMDATTLNATSRFMSEECSVDSGILGEEEEVHLHVGKKGRPIKADSARRMRLRAKSISTSSPDSSVASPELSRVVNEMTAFNDSQDQQWRVQAYGLLLQHSGNSAGLKRNAVRGLADILGIAVTDDDLAEV